MKKLDSNEFLLMRNYIAKSCGISLDENKAYLIESRLLKLLIENSCNNFSEFYFKASADKTNILRDKIIDAMTTNETLWFRDNSPFTILRETLFPVYAKEIESGKLNKIRIWSAACSTGQEPYSIAMSVHEIARQQKTITPKTVEIIATDISPTSLSISKAGNYDSMVISRGLPQELRQRYFIQNGNFWTIKDELKNMVNFRKLNLQETFTSLGQMDIVFCRNVLIYFADSFKIDVLNRIAGVLRQSKGYLFLGASESISNYSQDFTTKFHEKSMYYQVK
jgi:chemotaxis protein methyltransferase CheR